MVPKFQAFPKYLARPPAASGLTEDALRAAGFLC